MNYHKIFNHLRSIQGKKHNNINWEGIELISIHIPKTAGTSFYQTLKKQYSARKVVRVDISTVKKARINKVPINQAYVYPSPKVIHGHFSKKNWIKSSKHQQTFQS